MTCRSGCLSKDHRSYGDCLRAAAIQIDKHSLAHSSTAERDKDQRLSRYADAKSQGLQPRNTQWHNVRDAFENGGVEHSVVTKPGE